MNYQNNLFKPRTNIFNRILAYDLSNGQYAVFGSALMDVMGIRPAADLDIIVTLKLYKQLKRKGWTEHQANGFTILRKGDADVTTSQDRSTDGDYHPDRMKMIKEAIVINSCPFVRIEEVIACKTAYNRQKDINDIIKIKEFLNKYPDTFPVK